jgi:type IV pilus assembly protein PilV
MHIHESTRRSMPVVQTASRRPRRATARPQERGIALLEVLVAILIFMLGVLGLIGLQGSMTRAQTESKVRADAAYLASEVIGRMWADIINVDAYAGTDSCTASSCAEWRSKVGKVLPSGDAVITVDSVTGNVSVTVTWKTPDGQSHKYVTSTTIASKSG